VQYGLPIRHFGCNSAAGTATNPYMCLGAWLSVNTNVGYNHQLQYAAPLELDNGQTYSMPWLGSALFNTAEALKYHIYSPDSAWAADVTTSVAAAYGSDPEAWETQRY